MTRYAITIEATIDAPDKAEEILAHNNTVVGFKLSDGRLLKPWITWELEDPTIDRSGDVSADVLSALGFENFEYDNRVLAQVE